MYLEKFIWLLRNCFVHFKLFSAEYGGKYIRFYSFWWRSSRFCFPRR